jgi:hypothetical protein
MMMIATAVKAKILPCCLLYLTSGRVTIIITNKNIIAIAPQYTIIRVRPKNV